MGSVISGPKKPKPQEPSAEEKRLAALREREQQLAEAERTKEIQKQLRDQTLQNSSQVGRRSLLSRGNTGFSTTSLRSLLGGAQ